jgi:hypothetical protein
MRTGYSFDDLDWQAIESAPPQTTADLSDGSYDYPLSGEPSLVVRLAVNPGASPVDVRVVGDLDATLQAKLETLLALLADVRPGRWYARARSAA